jgi:hypothetical protein
LTRGYSLLAVGRQYHLPEGFDSGSQVSLIASLLMFESLIRRNAARVVRKVGYRTQGYEPIHDDWGRRHDRGDLDIG